MAIPRPSMLAIAEKPTWPTDFCRSLPVASSKRVAVAAAHDRRDAAFQEAAADEKIGLLLAYARALAIVEPRCSHLQFKWGESFHPETTVTGSINLEKSAVIFNLGALYSKVADTVDLSTDSGLKEAYQLYQKAAGAFRWLIDSGTAAKAIIEGVSITDLKPECLTMLCNLMLAQAQECYFYKSLAAKKPSQMLSKLAKQVYIFYQEALEVACTHAFSNEFDELWVSHIKLKKYLFSAESCYSFSLDLHKDEELGEEISYLDIAQSALADAKETPGEVYARALGHARKLESDIVCSLEKARHQNNRFYHLVVPDGNSLNLLPALCVVKPKLTEFGGLFPSVTCKTAESNSPGIETSKNIMGKNQSQRSKGGTPSTNENDAGKKAVIPGLRRLCKQFETAESNSLGIVNSKNMTVENQLQKFKGGTPSTSEKSAGKKVVIPGRRRLCKQFSESYCSTPEEEKIEDVVEWQMLKDCFILKPIGNKNRVALKIPSEVFMDRLADYQRAGIKWLWHLHCKGEGGILADDMGLGKTRQLSVFLVALFELRIIKRVLILAPTSVLNGWTKELSDRGMNMPVKLFCSGDPSRDTSLQTIITEGGVLLTTYSMFRLHFHDLSGNVGDKSRVGIWNYLIMDEGHQVKSPKSAINALVRQIICPHKIIVTGTPVQNSMQELYALIMVCCPSILGDKKSFAKRYAKPISNAKYKAAPDEDQAKSQKAFDELRRLTNPRILRRTKQFLVETGSLQLPNKTELTIWLKLTACQEMMYKTLLTSQSLQKSLQRAPLVTINILQKICNHPMLLKNKIQDKDLLAKEMSLAQSVSFELADMMRAAGTKISHEDSSKIIFVKSLLENLLPANHRVLIFSQSKKMLDLIQEALSSSFERCRMLRVDGDVKRADRDKIIEDFQTNTVNPAYIFLLTTQVGGFGINLTKASRVIIIDPSWNPSTDNQTVDRAYRLGRSLNEDVIVYRLVTCATVEDKAYRLQVIKGTDTTMFTEKKDLERYFCEEAPHEVFVLPKSFDVSQTRIDLQKAHGSLVYRDDEDDLKNHAIFLKTIPSVLDLTNHSILFTKEAKKLAGAFQEDYRQKSGINARSSCYKKAPTDVVIGGQKYAFEPRSEIFKKPAKCIIDVVKEESRIRQLRIKHLKAELPRLEDQFLDVEGGLGFDARDNWLKKISNYKRELASLLEEEYPGSGSSTCNK